MIGSSCLSYEASETQHVAGPGLYVLGLDTGAIELDACRGRNESARARCSGAHADTFRNTL